MPVTVLPSLTVAYRIAFSAASLLAAARMRVWLGG
jgi:hypothetical protein